METVSDTIVPPELAAPAAPVSPSRETIKAYQKIKRICHLVGIVLNLVYWLVWLFLADDFVAWLTTHLETRWPAMMIAGLVMFGGLILASLPLHYYSSYIVEKRFDLSTQTTGSWLVFELKGWLVGFVIGGLLLAGLYALLWYAGTWWSVWVWVGVMAFSILLAKIFPLIILPIFYPAKPLDRPSLTERLATLAEQAGMKISGTYNLELSKETRKANAMLAGLGSTRRVYLSDTLLERFDDNQIMVVFAHELGHHIRGHIFKGILLAAVVSSVLVALIHWRLDPVSGNDPAHWPTAIALLAQVGLIMTVYPLVIGPITNAISRHFERQADTDALRLTNDPASFRSAFELLIDMNLADPEPPRWEEILFDDHPAMAKRIAMADAYAGQAPAPT